MELGQRLLVLGLLLPHVRCFSVGTSAAHPPCGGAPPSARRINTVSCVLADDSVKAKLHAVETTVHAVEATEHATRLVGALERAVADRRRVDELVTLFQYNAKVEAAGAEYVGQGAVKRFFSTVLTETELTGLELLDAPTSQGASDTMMNIALTSEAGQHEVALVADFDGAGLVRELQLQEVSAPAGVAPLLAPPSLSASGGADGPKWETFDGRVRQKIWQRESCFAAGNTFIKETLELSTGRLIMIVDQNVWDLYGEQMEAWAQSVELKLDAVVTPGNEDHKTLETFTFLLDELKRTDPLRRSEPVLAVGGGVLTDTAGFACACWRRGVPWARMPTTLLGMVDASVGIKVAINYHRKNGVGHFYSPIHTFIDEAFLRTVPLADIRSGVGEIMKAALVHDERIWRLMVDHGERLIEERFMGSAEASEVIKLSVDAMLECIGPDLWEEALLRPMDFGHSFSRTLETDERFQLRHGEAVAIDCIFNALIAEQKGLLPPAQVDDLLALYATLGLPCSIDGITADTYKRARNDIIVHRDGLLRAPLPGGAIGTCVYVDDLSDDEIERAFARLTAFMERNPQACWDVSKSFNPLASASPGALNPTTPPAHEAQ